MSFRMRRVDAALRGEAGVQILTAPLLAARLSGGFVRPAGPRDLYPAIRDALDEGGFAELEGVRQLPGTPRAVARTLAKAWESDLSLSVIAESNERVADLAEIERRVRLALPAGVMTPRDLRDAALKRVAHARVVLGPIELHRAFWVAPVWRPLLVNLSEEVPISWFEPGMQDTGWFPGRIAPWEPGRVPDMSVVSCANPRSEAIEALRWMRELISSGQARPEQIAICATDTQAWDEHFVALSQNADLPLHFTRGIPALASRDGQACAALADVLLHGLSQDRIRRLFAYSVGRSRALGDVPANWSAGLQQSATLFELEHWRRALELAANRRTDGFDPGPAVLPALRLLSNGIETAEQVGAMLLPPVALALWTEALRRAPARALEYSLQELRVPDRRDPSASAVWCPASHLATGPRPWVRLLGMTSRSWPRREESDPIVPDHVMPRRNLDPYPIPERDRHAFIKIAAHAQGGCVLSRSRRNAQGALLSASPLIPRGVQTADLKRERLPQHAFNEADRLFSRPYEASTSPLIVAAKRCWQDWSSPQVNAHDGIVRTDHPVIVRAIGQVQSASSLKLMLRNPLAYVWRYALGWHGAQAEEQPLALDARGYGELVHDLLKRTVDSLEPTPGFTRASRHQVEAAIAASVSAVRSSWPIERSVPPALLWQHTLDDAARQALKALTFETFQEPDTRSWTEVAFGYSDANIAKVDEPWCSSSAIDIPGTDLRIRGRIDRLDLRADGRAVRVSDYKTGTAPRRAQELMLSGGAEIQRVVYALAAQRLLPDIPRVVARLVFLGDQEVQAYGLPDVDQAIAELGTHLTAAVGVLRSGVVLPGPDAREEQNDFRLAMPASPSAYFRIKNSSISRAFGDFGRVWSSR
ncbi:PD-(D/E)XK nuclease family protein (plasmid) [Ensifer adhaerens]|uniref:PD-(D/E)XK nuclease family protein n=1 Tax=Ensifer adhaerens TaxID=106592 RepID=UPI0023A9494A|nr:PD-(D/E)XK nuclease family protein [Ensifer adhaerens]WDZ79055.1 PD-(D/E)XK nuclease family protein [Ensifer adhaerens]